VTKMTVPFVPFILFHSRF